MLTRTQLRSSQTTLLSFLGVLRGETSPSSFRVAGSESRFHRGEGPVFSASDQRPGLRFAQPQPPKIRRQLIALFLCVSAVNTPLQISVRQIGTSLADHHPAVADGDQPPQADYTVGRSDPSRRLCHLHGGQGRIARLELFRALRSGLRPHTRFVGFAAYRRGRYA